MSKKWLTWALLALLIGSFLALATFLPRRGIHVFLSPDETAVSVAARAFVQDGDMKVHDDLLQLYPWMRPRSFVTQGNAMVPVGFLGMPLLMGLLLALVGSGAFMWLTPFAAASVLYPLWRFTARWRRGSRWAVLLIWCSFPTVLLYAGRGLFPNLPLVCAMVWAAYLVWSGKKPVAYVAAAFLTGLAIALRPTEAPWMAAWLYSAYLLRDTTAPFAMRTRQRLAVALSAALFPLIAAFIALRTYGSPLSIGYWLRDTQAATAAAAGPMATNTATIWPFGFHPMNMLFNAREYLLYFLAPWTAVCVMAAALAWRERKERIIMIACAVTATVLLFVYGQSIYQDHVGVNVVSLGNSFLRYLLPLTPFAVLAMGWLCERLYGMRPKRDMLLILMIGVWILASFGIWTAIVRDNEGLLADSIESMRYAGIRAAAVEMMPPGSIVLSERSDKIFFPAFRAASPMPSMAEVSKLFSPGMPDVYYFGSELTGTALDAWANAGLVPDPVLRSDGQVLYHIADISKAAS